MAAAVGKDASAPPGEVGRAWVAAAARVVGARVRAGAVGRVAVSWEGAAERVGRVEGVRVPHSARSRSLVVSTYDWPGTIEVRLPYQPYPA